MTVIINAKELVLAPTYGCRRLMTEIADGRLPKRGTKMPERRWSRIWTIKIRQGFTVILPIIRLTSLGTRE